MKVYSASINTLTVSKAPMHFLSTAHRPLGTSPGLDSVMLVDVLTYSIFSVDGKNTVGARSKDCLPMVNILCHSHEDSND